MRMHTWLPLASILLQAAVGAGALEAQDDDRSAEITQPEAWLKVNDGDKAKLRFTANSVFGPTDGVPITAKDIRKRLTRVPTDESDAELFVLEQTSIAMTREPRRALLTISWQKALAEDPILDYYDVVSVKGARTSYGYCEYMPIKADATSHTFYGTELGCQDKRLNRAVLIEVKIGAACVEGPTLSVAGCDYSYIYLPDSTGIFLGESLGFSVTYVDQWDESSRPDANPGESFRANTAGAGFYYSLANVKTERARWIASFLAMDLDPEIDLELGIGTGLMFKITEDQGGVPGFGIAAGVGYNFMVDESENAWFTFLGLTIEIGGRGNGDGD